MTLTKNLSILPSRPEIEQTVEEVADGLRALKRSVSSADTIPDHISADDTEKENVPMSAYLTLGSAVCSLSSIGPFLAKQKNVDACLKIVWRFQGTAILLAPLAFRSLYVDGAPQLTGTQWGTFFLSSASYAVLCVGFAMSINYTTVANATILTNSQSVLLVASKMFVGQKVVFLEGFGVLVAFLGGILCAKESAGLEGAPATGWLSVWGDALGIISSIGGIGYIILGKSLRSTMPVLIFMVLNMTVASFMILLYMWVEGHDISWDRQINHGLFGWMNFEGDRLPLELATVIVCNLMGTMGYVRAFKYFSSVIIAVAALMEPVVAAFTAVGLGVGVFPGVEGWIGNLLVAAGTLAVLYPTTQSGKEEIKPPKAPRTPYPRMKSPRLLTRAPPTIAERAQYTDRTVP